MEKRDDFEHRLGQGLKRWAEAGHPTLNLEAYVTGAAPASAPEPAMAPARPRRPWLRWATSAAAAVLLLAGATFTFPAWAGTAAAWPLVGPVIQEMIMKDAGLKWAYDAGLIQGTVAEGTVNGVTVRILAVVPDQAITTILYQVEGLPERSFDDGGRPVQVGRGGLLGFLTHPVSTQPILRVEYVPGNKGNFTTWGQTVDTPLGLYGTITTSGINAEGEEMVLAATVGGERLELRFPVSRSASDGLTREYPVGQSRTIDDVTYTIDAVLQTPVHTVVRYRVTKPGFYGSFSWSNHEFSMRLETGGGGPIYDVGNYGQDDSYYALFPRTKLPARLVLPASIKGVAVDAVWPLQSGTVREIQGVPVTLVDWEATGDKLAVSYQHPFAPELVAFTEFEAIEADGTIIPLREEGSSWSDLGGPGRSEYREVTRAFSFPEGAKPVAVRAKRAAVPVTGPWVFQLPAE